MTLAVSIAQQGSNNTTFRNRIINGAMVIDQRNAGASFTPTANPQYTIDRWFAAPSSASKFSVQQSTTAPTGFTYSLKMTSLAATTVGSTDFYVMYQAIEGYNSADLAWGTASAATVTLSFWVQSSLTGTFGGSLLNEIASVSYPFTYTISSANTWEKKTVTIAGPTSGTFGTTNGVGFFVGFSLGAGATASGTAGAWSGTFYRSATSAVQVVATNGATFYITGVQLEAGSTASPFEYRSYGTELALCQRYFFQYQGNATATPIGPAYLASTVSAQGYLQFPVPMRSAPTQTGSAATDIQVTWSAGTSTTSALTLDLANTLTASLRITTTGLTTGQGGYFLIAAGTSKYLAFSAEL
jgi:hypothetical protein